MSTLETTDSSEAETRPVGLQQPLIEYGWLGEDEDPSAYRKGGFHPVILGDLLPKAGTCENDPAKKPRYHIWRKIANGDFSTTWLAHDRGDGANDPGRSWVSVKICKGSTQDQWEWDRETLILRHLQTAGPGGALAHPTVLELYDSFVIKGPNGFHNCLVTEVVGRHVDFVHRGYYTRCPPGTVMEQAVAGFARLHQEGIAHGDIHGGNIGVAIPKIQELCHGDFGDLPEIHPLVARDAVPEGTDAPHPPYLVSCEGFDLAACANKENALPSLDEITVKIIDYGRAFWIEKPPRSLLGTCAEPNTPPEIFVLERPEKEANETHWTEKSDIWALAVLLCQVRFGHHFEPVHISGSRPERFSGCFRLGGPPPTEWIEAWNARETTTQLEPTSPTTGWSYDETWAKLQDDMARVDSYWPDDVPAAFLDLLQKMLVTRPEDRITAEQAASHRFFELERAHRAAVAWASHVPEERQDAAPPPHAARGRGTGRRGRAARRGGDHRDGRGRGQQRWRGRGRGGGGEGGMGAKGSGHRHRGRSRGDNRRGRGGREASEGRTVDERRSAL